ncbi:MAG: hypothetical protein JRD89_20750 [Deltaproteobacteria bacterium]|nr:hypothetical protein [Deltaproteobacteria bacterium]
MPKVFKPVDERVDHSTRQITISLSEGHYKKLKYLKAKTNISMKRYVEVWVGNGIDEELEEHTAALHLRDTRLQEIRKEFGDT